MSALRPSSAPLSSLLFSTPLPSASTNQLSSGGDHLNEQQAWPAASSSGLERDERKIVNIFDDVQDLIDNWTPIRAQRMECDTSKSVAQTPTHSSNEDLPGHGLDLFALREEHSMLQRSFVELTTLVGETQKQLQRKDDLISKLQEDNSWNSLNGPRNSENGPNVLSSAFARVLAVDEARLAAALNALKLDQNVQINSQHDQEPPHQLFEALRTVLVELWPKIGLVAAAAKTAARPQSEPLEPPRQHKKLSTSQHQEKMFYNSLLQTLQLFTDVEPSNKRLSPQTKAFEDFKTIDDATAAVHSGLVRLIEENSSLKIELEAQKRSRQVEEEQVYRLVQAVAEAEMELELLSRRPSTLKDVISNFIKTTCSNVGQSYTSSLTKLVLQIYSNQLKWLETASNSNGSGTQDVAHKMSLNYNLWQDGDFEYEIPLDNVQVSSVDDAEDDNEVAELLQRERSESRDDNFDFDQSLGHLSEAEVDEKKVNYILLGRPYSGKLQGGLEVVHEEDETAVVEEDDDEQYENSSDFDMDTTTASDGLKVDKSDRSEQVRLLVDDMLSFVEHQTTRNLTTRSLNCSLEVLDGDMIEPSGIRSKRSLSNHDLTEALMAFDGQEEALDTLTTPQTIQINVHSPSARSSSNDPHLWRKASLDSAVGSDISPNSATSSQFRSSGATEEDKATMARFQANAIKAVLERNAVQAELDVAKVRISGLEVAVAQAKEAMVAAEKSKKSNHLDDELSAWKEIVDQQRAILEKVTVELEETQSKLCELEKTSKTMSRPQVADCEVQTDFKTVQEEKEVPRFALEANVSSSFGLGGLWDLDSPSPAHSDFEDDDDITLDVEDIELDSPLKCGGDRNNNHGPSSAPVGHSSPATTADPLKHIETDDRKVTRVSLEEELSLRSSVDEEEEESEDTSGVRSESPHSTAPIVLTRRRDQNRPRSDVFVNARNDFTRNSSRDLPPRASSNTYSDSYKRFAHRKPLKMAKVEIVYIASKVKPRTDGQVRSSSAGHLFLPTLVKVDPSSPPKKPPFVC